eukprot:COSAG01_NODE_10599_length_2124_cov_3.556049_2_plen_146_part_00
MAQHGQLALRRLTLHYCQRGGSSRGAREFIERDIAEFARRNPLVEVHTRVRNGRHPYLQGLFPAHAARFEAAAGGSYQPDRADRTIELSVKNLPSEGVLAQIEQLRARTGKKAVRRLKKWWYSRHPSIQGVWKPGLFGSPSSAAE